MRLLSIIACTIAVALTAAAAPRTNPSNQACIAVPTKVCVFDWARSNAHADERPAARAKAIAQVALAEIDSGLKAEALRDAQELADLAPRIDHDETRLGTSYAIAEIRAKAGDFDGAKNAVPSPNGDYHYWTSAALRTIAVELVKSGKTAEALTLLRAHETTKDDVNIIREFAWDVRDIVVERGEEAGVAALLSHAEEIEDAKPETFRFFTAIHHPSVFVSPLMIIAAAEARAEKFDAALNLAREIRKPSSRAEVVAAVGRVLALRGNTDRALELARRVADPIERGILLRRMYVRRGWEGASELLGSEQPGSAEFAARAFAASMKAASAFTAREQEAAFALIADVTAKAGLIADAITAASRMPSPRLGPKERSLGFWVWLAIAEAQAKSGDRSGSLASFSRAGETARRDPDEASALSEIARAEAKWGFIDEALAVADAIPGAKTQSSESVNGKPVDQNRLFAIYEIAKAMAKAGRIEEAQRLARETEYDGGRTGNGVGVVAEGLAEAGRIDEALKAAKAETNPYWRDDLLLDLVRARAAAGKIGDADRLRRGIVRDVERARALLAIAEAQFKAASLATPKALGAVSEALRLTTTMEYPNLALDILVEAGRILPTPR
ncbi:MAG: hypothetical protein GC190_07720 [Alphaproteobacteria bacterium]|nr:hypothetical protein [Alphaproteobacteria bacterium]